MDVLDNHIPLPERDFKSPFLMPIEKSVSVPGRGQVLVGTVQRGTAKKGDQLEIVGFDEVIKTGISEIHIFNNSVTECKSGENCGILARGIKPNMIQRGMMVAAPNSVQQTDHFEASVYVLKKNEGGRAKPIIKGYIQPFYTKTVTISSNLQLIDEKDMLMPGDHANVKFILKNPIVILPGDRFTIREGHTLTSITGVVSKVLPKSNISIFGFNKMRPINPNLKRQEKSNAPKSDKTVKKTTKK